MNPLKLAAASPPSGESGWHRGAVHPGIAGLVRGLLGLIRIGAMRSWGWIVIPLMVVSGAMFVHQQLMPGVVLWGNLSTNTGATTLFLAPLAMAYTAWRSQSSRWAGTVELESVAPMSSLVRDLGRILPATVIVVIGQTALIALVLGYGLLNATWGSPLWWPLVLSVVAIFTAGIIGGVVGCVAPWRLAPPALAMVTFGWSVAVESQVFGFQRSNSFRMFSPFAVAEREHFDPFWEFPTSGMAREFTLVVALAGLAALVGFAFFRNRSFVTLALAVIVCGATVFSGAMHRERWIEAMHSSIGRSDPRPFAYACERWHDGVVCVHPAFTSLIDDLGAGADRVLAPIAGLPGLQTSVRHMSANVPDDGLTFWTDIRSLGDDWQLRYGHSIIRQMVGLGGGNESYPNLMNGKPSQPDAAQMVIGRWLSEEAGLDTYQLFGPVPPSDMEGGTWFPGWKSPEPDWSVAVGGAEERFAALSPEEQRAWLEANWNALLAGTLTLEDLP